MIVRYDLKAIMPVLERDRSVRARTGGPDMVAEAGDIKIMNGREYESVGNKNPRGLSQDRPLPPGKKFDDADELPIEQADPKNPGKREYWVRRRATS